MTFDPIKNLKNAAKDFVDKMSGEQSTKAQSTYSTCDGSGRVYKSDGVGIMTCYTCKGTGKI